MIALPGQLFYTTQIPVCLWFLARTKSNGKFRARKGETLFIDARKLGGVIDRTHRELSNDEIARIAGTYHALRGELRMGADKARISPASASPPPSRRFAPTATS